MNDAMLSAEEAGQKLSEIAKAVREREGIGDPKGVDLCDDTKGDPDLAAAIVTLQETILALEARQSSGGATGLARSRISAVLALGALATVAFVIPAILLRDSPAIVPLLVGQGTVLAGVLGLAHVIAKGDTKAVQENARLQAAQATSASDAQLVKARAEAISMVLTAAGTMPDLPPSARARIIEAAGDAIIGVNATERGS